MIRCSVKAELVDDLPVVTEDRENIVVVTRRELGYKKKNGFATHRCLVTMKPDRVDTLAGIYRRRWRNKVR